MDFWINQTIIDADPKEEIVAMPRDEAGNYVGCLDPRFKGYTVKQIFFELYEEKKKRKEEGKADETDEADGEADGNAGGGSGGGGFDEHDWDGASSMTEEEQTSHNQDVDSAIRQGVMAAKKMGKGSGSNLLGLGDLLKPQVNWLEQFKQFLRMSMSKATGSSFRRLNRRYLSIGLFVSKNRKSSTNGNPNISCWIQKNII